MYFEHLGRSVYYKRNRYHLYSFVLFIEVGESFVYAQAQAFSGVGQPQKESTQARRVSF